MMKKHTVRFEPIGRVYEVTHGSPLHDLIHEYGVEFPCGGEGTCGGCKVKLLNGFINLDDHHRALLNKQRLDDTWRLACLSYITEDVTLEVHQYESLILADNTVFSFVPQSGHGIAVDLGTTTLVAQLIDLANGHVLDVQTAMNAQSRFGADIMSRVLHALDAEGAAQLTGMIREQIGGMVAELLKNKKTDLQKILIVGNSVMHHLFCGIDVKPLSAYPLESPDTAGKTFTPSELGWNLDAKVRVTFMPNIGSFVGSDILAGIFASSIHKSEKYIALIDLGTNGEIVVGNKNKLVCASTAAGPAFEGTNISMGMKATTGAISSVHLHEGKIHAHVIGNASPRGICGSGLIDAVSALLETGDIDIAGQISGDREKIAVAGDVFLNQKDFREFQLAKAAIAAGLDILIRHLGITHADVEKIYIAGAFGTFINLQNTINLGMLEFPAEKISKLGNSALIGAKMFLFNNTAQDEILPLCSHISLESDKNFQDVYVGKMFFMVM